jgi:thiamine biosynthesis lipoprotein
MGSRFDITVVAASEQQGNEYRSSPLQRLRIENSYHLGPSITKPAVNRNAGIEPVKVDAELFQLIQRAIGISKLTDGALT